MENKIYLVDLFPQRQCKTDYVALILCECHAFFYSLVSASILLASSALAVHQCLSAGIKYEFKVCVNIFIRTEKKEHYCCSFCYFWRGIVVMQRPTQLLLTRSKIYDINLFQIFTCTKI